MLFLDICSGKITKCSLDPKYKCQEYRKCAKNLHYFYLSKMHKGHILGA